MKYLILAICLFSIFGCSREDYCANHTGANIIAADKIALECDKDFFPETCAAYEKCYRVSDQCSMTSCMNWLTNQNCILAKDACLRIADMMLAKEVALQSGNR
jgi:hypothetical protein